MSVSSYRVLANVAVSDVEAARKFYEGKLGLAPVTVRGDGGTTYDCGDGTSLHIYSSPDNAGLSSATQVGWVTPEIEAAVAELVAAGVEFEQYDSGSIQTDERGIATIGDDRAAWFKDPDGNILGLITG
ncbi:MAG: VOC family protein [Thermoleophilia bacterium]|jgi:catechol 2,3-dioxygenase-like lactoylglutathione lyase family enzyme|nr:VOC family protein [Thermoleophilia bacterium]